MFIYQRDDVHGVRSSQQRHLRGHRGFVSGDARRGGQHDDGVDQYCSSGWYHVCAVGVVLCPAEAY